MVVLFFFFPHVVNLSSLGKALGRLVGVRNVYIWVFSLALDGLEVTRLVVRPSMTVCLWIGLFLSC